MFGRQFAGKGCIHIFQAVRYCHAKALAIKTDFGKDFIPDSHMKRCLLLVIGGW